MILRFLYALRLCLFGFLLLFVFVCGVGAPSYAAESDIGVVDRAALLKESLRRFKNGYSRANIFLEEAGITRKSLDLRGLPDGELLIFEVILKEEGLRLEGDVFAEVSGDTVVFSLRDMITLLNFPIDYEPETGDFSGWFIREDQSFRLDSAAGLVRAGGKDFKIAESMRIRDDDIYVSLSDVEAWFGLVLDVNVGTQQVALESDPPLPVVDRLRRRRYKVLDNSRKPASLPRGEDGYDWLGFPLVDVSTTNTYSKGADAKGEFDRTHSIRTANEFARGALTTTLSGDDENALISAQVKYLQESDQPELLGPLKARRFEVGDVLPTFLPITGNASVETGTRITNVDPFVQQRFPQTQISGSIFPGWDIELYRDGALLAFQETDENGFYLFDNIQLFSNENSFRIVAYGPQGEVREEEISVPFDQSRETAGEIVYDASLSFQETQTFSRFLNDDDPDKGTPHFVGFLEAPITDKATVLLGGRYRQEQGEDKVYASAGVATTLAGTLLNADFAVDESGEHSSEFVVGRRFGPHALRGNAAYRSDAYDPGQAGGAVDVFDARVALEGPLPYGLGRNPRYSLGFGYDEDAEGESSVNAVMNLNTRLENIGVSQSFNYIDTSTSEDASIRGTTSVSGSFGKNFIRGLANYTYEPDPSLDTLSASWRRRINSELDTTLDISREVEGKRTRYAAFMNWRPEHATISPSISVDSDNNVIGMLNTRFGVTRVPDQGGFVFTREFVTTNGTINAFVFLDKDGNLIFDGEDEPIPDARVRVPQNGQGEVTDESGLAFIDQLIPNILTDVFVDRASLSDPFWIPAREGVSILPRTGTNNRVDLPVHVAGEMDGTVYARKPDGSASPLRDLTLSLYDQKGEVVKTTRVASDGFYIFDLIPPGSYSLLVEETRLPEDIRRPKPQAIEIGYDGTTIFGNDIFLQAGVPDIPSEIVADIEDYKKYHPHIDFSAADYKVAMNLGEYSSRLLTSVMWYRLRSRYGAIFEGTQLYVPPSQSYAVAKTGLHVLRVGLKTENIDDAYNRCRALVARGLYCKVEILPTAGEQKLAANGVP